MEDRERLVDLANKVRARAQGLRDEAAHDGRYDDGGAAALEAQVECFFAGLDGRLPNSWQAHAEELRRAEERDFADYQRLWAKYRGQRPRGT